MSRLPQLLPGQQTIPWYHFDFFWWGMAIVIVAILILIVPLIWGRILHSLLRFSRWIRQTYHMALYGPKITIGSPTFTSLTREDVKETIIVSTLLLSIISGRKPVRISLHSIMVCVEAEIGWDKRKTKIALYEHNQFPEIELKPGESWHDSISISTRCVGNKDTIPHVKAALLWGIDGILVTLPKIRPPIRIHKGIKPEKSKHLVNLI